MIGILGIVVIIVATVMAYRTARDYERNAAVWAAIVFAVGFGIQIILPFFVAIIAAVVMVAGGSTPMEMQAALDVPAMIFGIVCIILSVVAMLLILRYLAKLPEENFDIPPAPPSDFS